MMAKLIRLQLVERPVEFKPDPGGGILVDVDALQSFGDLECVVTSLVREYFTQDPELEKRLSGCIQPMKSSQTFMDWVAQLNFERADWLDKQ